MNFMSYVAEVSRGWDEPNARDMGRMTSQPKAKGEIYILNDGMNMKAEIAAMERRLEKLEMTNMQPVQAISQTPLQAMPCAICLSYEHLGEECPTIPAVREMFGDCNTYNSNWRDPSKFSCKPQPPQYKQHVQALPQASILEQAMVNLSKFVGDFIGAQKSINAQINQKIDSVESSLIKRMDEMQNDLSQKLDILQDSISRLANLNTVQEKENSPSQPYQNSMSIHEMEAKEGELSQKRKVKEVITLRSGKEVDLPTCKLEHKEVFRSKIGVKRGENRGKTGVCEISQPLRNQHFVAKPFRNPIALSAKIFAAAKPILAHECHFAAQEHLFRSCETHCEVVKPDFAPKVPFRRVFHNCEGDFGTRVPFHSTVTLISQLRNGCEVPKREKSQFHSRTPISTIVGHISITSRSSNYACNISFESLGSHESTASNGARFGYETKKLWPFENDCANHERKCRTSILLLLDTFLKHFLELKLCIPYLVSKLGKSGVQCFKRIPLLYEIHPSLRKCSKLQKWYVNMPLFCEMISKLRNGCEITSKLRNGLQIAKLTCEMEGDLQKHFAKPREVAKMPTEPRDHASEEESPEHLEITHTKSLTPLLTSLNHQIP
ncbi:hypothetical protein CK203_091308 [Vitis vinifera]|uniref:Uncharacterized protein n=1 Tax=Vitis vinifera TaxID=29760 RepID=A0A438CLH8_VITVI|nr:hypothetical protein CK203_091308 [Vitis vinifera]